jgi:hypothetical protein
MGRRRISLRGRHRRRDRLGGFARLQPRTQKPALSSSAFDPLTFAVTALILIAAAPGFLYPPPAAPPVDPMIALSYE